MAINIVCQIFYFIPSLFKLDFCWCFLYDQFRSMAKIHYTIIEVSLSFRINYTAGSNYVPENLHQDFPWTYSTREGILLRSSLYSVQVCSICGKKSVYKLSPLLNLLKNVKNLSQLGKRHRLPTLGQMLFCVWMFRGVYIV